MELKFPPLTADDIEAKVKKITSKGAIVLLYKTARTDMSILDNTVGSMDWKCSYRDVKGNLYCEISIYDKDKKEWVSKEDCGIESREDDEGNQHKGEASDAFKRAGFKWGIGRELYTAPFIFIRCATQKRQNGKGYELANPFTRFTVKSIAYDDLGRINELSIVDSNGQEVYNIKSPIKPHIPQYIDANKQTALMNELHRTGQGLAQMLHFIDKKFPDDSPNSIGKITEKQFAYIAKVFEKMPDKAAKNQDDKK